MRWLGKKENPEIVQKARCLQDAFKLLKAYYVWNPGEIYAHNSR